jgi:putative transposase
LEGGRGRLVNDVDRSQAVELINEACASGARKQAACELMGISVRTCQRWEKTSGQIDRRKGAPREVGNRLTSGEKALILETINSELYRDLSPCQIVPLLADQGYYLASESSFYRILREQKQLTHRQWSRPVNRTRPEPCEANGSNQVWSWDITYLPSRIMGIYFYLYMIIDVYSRKIVGWSIHDEQSGNHAANLIQEASRDEGVDRDQLILHSDNGTPMKGAVMLAALQKLGVMPSFSRPSVSDDNPYSEALFKTLKYHSRYPMHSKFESTEQARDWCLSFVDWYNVKHLHSGLKFVTPNQRHTSIDQEIRAKRYKVYEQAQQKHPERWSGKMRNWEVPDSVTLNPNRKERQASSQENENLMKVA